MCAYEYPAGYEIMGKKNWYQNMFYTKFTQPG